LTVLAAALLALSVSLALLLPGLATAGPGDFIKAFGPDGTASTEFGKPVGLAVDQETGAVYVADSETQTLEKFDAEGNPLDYGGGAGYISKNKITGLSLNGSPQEAEVAIDPETHVVYVTSGDRVRAFEPDGEPHNFTEGNDAGSSELSGAADLWGVAVDQHGDIYASDFESEKVRIYSRAGALITEFAPRVQAKIIRPSTMAVASDGTLYITDVGFQVDAFEPSQFPVSGKTTYSFGQPVNDSTAVSVAVDPVTQYVYIDQLCGFSASKCDDPAGVEITVYDENGAFLGAIGAKGPQALAENGPVGVNGGIKRVYVAQLHGGGALAQVSVFEAISFFVGIPTVSNTSVKEISADSAMLRAKINPNTLPTNYHFEYGLQDCAVSACTSVPVPNGAIGEGHEPVLVSQPISGLQPGTTYHYRVVAVNDEGPTKTPDRTFTTDLTGLGFALSDQRAWELVSPSDKHGAKLTRGSLGVSQAAADGSGIVYESPTSIEEAPQGNRAQGLSVVLARRNPLGDWTSKDLTPPHQEVSVLRFGSEFKAFSPDLGRAVFEQQGETPLSPAASEETPYLRTNTEPAGYTPLVTAKEGYANVPLGTKFGSEGANTTSTDSLVAIKAADSGLDHLVLKSVKPLFPNAAPNSLYLWAGGQLAPVSELPAGEEVSGIVAGWAGNDYGSISHAISEDGRRVFWQAEGSTLGLYVRDTVNQVTGRLDVRTADADGEGNAKPLFQGASADGTVVFFTDTQRLTADGSAPDNLQDTRDLYRCEVAPVEGGTLGCTTLTDISAPIEGSGERSEVVGLSPAIADNGSSAYFVARGRLDTAPNEAGEVAVAGQPNLYLWQEGMGARFIATLSEQDSPDWGVGNESSGRGRYHTSKLSAAGSPDGRYLAFMSQRSLTGYENADATSFEPVEEVFRYDSSSQRLACLSCNPSGASPQGEFFPERSSGLLVDPGPLWKGHWVAAILPNAQETEGNFGLTFHRPRVVLDNGRVFFNSVDPLVRADSNGGWDVYQWEPTGVGDCTSSPEGSAQARSAGGCVSLLSSGTAPEEASFLDSSESGNDVFFLTPARLSVADEDEELDLYDARVNGITATRTPSPECLGEACQPAAKPPNDPTPASAAFNGPGNVHPSARKCAKGKRAVVRKGKTRCVRRHPKKRHAHGDRRAHR